MDVGDQKGIILVSKQEAYGKERKRKEKKRKKREIKPRYGIFVWIHDFCMDFGMLFVYKLLGYAC